MVSMKKKVMATIQRYQMFEPGKTIVLAVSGGVDSMVLLHVLSEIKKEVDLTLVVAHMDHAKRHDSVLDARLVRQTAQRYGFAYEEATLPPQEKSGNFHAYARSHRYGFLRQIAVRYQACAVATAHHANDHLETVVAHLLSGRVPTGLIGIWPKGLIEDVMVIRPLIEITKETLYRYAQAFTVPWREDHSNATDCYTRNRIRKQIVPKLVDERQDVLVHARSLGDALAEDEAYFSAQVDALMVDVTSTATGYEMALSWLRTVHPSLKRRLMMRLIPNMSKGARMDLLDFIDQYHASASLDMGAGVVAQKKNDAFYLTMRSVSRVDFYEVNLTINAQATLPTGEKVFLFQGMRKKSEKFEKSEAQATYLCYNKIRLPLKVRNRRLGDRIQLVNQKGRAKVTQIMIDAKVPAHQRDKWPIVVDADDFILWIPGLKKSPFCLEKAASTDDVLIIFQL